MNPVMVDAMHKVGRAWHSHAHCLHALDNGFAWRCTLELPDSLGVRLQALEAYPMIDAPPSPGIEPDAAPQWSDKPSKGSAGAMHVHAYAPAVAHRFKPGEPAFNPLGRIDCMHVHHRDKGRPHRQRRRYH